MVKLLAVLFTLEKIISLIILKLGIKSSSERKDNLFIVCVYPKGTQDSGNGHI